jgi:hypothetical protein
MHHRPWACALAITAVAGSRRRSASSIRPSPLASAQALATTVMQADGIR